MTEMPIEPQRYRLTPHGRVVLNRWEESGTSLPDAVVLALFWLDAGDGAPVAAAGQVFDDLVAAGAAERIADPR